MPRIHSSGQIKTVVRISRKQNFQINEIVCLGPRGESESECLETHVLAGQVHFKYISYNSFPPNMLIKY